jgi:hypothetical protein
MTNYTDVINKECDRALIDEYGNDPIKRLKHMADDYLLMLKTLQKIKPKAPDYSKLKEYCVRVFCENTLGDK